MTVYVVRMPHIVHLETERVLQVIARLLVVQTGHDGSSLADIYYPYALGLRQRAGGLLNLAGRRYPVCVAAQTDLAHRAAASP